ncbi:MAG: response regulator [Bacteroidales bacterium]|nr:response regulator [Bacteroidales bacterium]
MTSNRKIRVLYVDDDLTNLELFQMTFHREFEITTSTSGKEALQILKKNNIDVVVTDYKMPEMNGMDLIKEIKQFFPNIKCIILSGYIGYEIIIEKKLIDGYINKPWKKELVIQTIKNLFTNSNE